MSDDNGELSFCGQCGGNRRHSILSRHHRPWEEDDAPVNGCDTWSTMECRGCGTISFVHTHWFSEDTELGDDGMEPIIYRQLYPPAPSRKKPEWARYLSFPFSSSSPQWNPKLHTNIYAAIGIGAAALAAMGIRTIIDSVVTSQVGDNGGFDQKLKRMHEKNLISEAQVEILTAAFDGGSAATHRGHHPERGDLDILLDTAESLLYQVHVAPGQQKQQSAAAAKLRSRTPPRPTPNKSD